MDSIHIETLVPVTDPFDSYYTTRFVLSTVLLSILICLLIWRSRRLSYPVEPSPYNTLTDCLIMGSALNAEDDLIKHYFPSDEFKYSERVQECKHFARHYDYNASPPLYDTHEFITKIVYLHEVAPTITGNVWLKNTSLRELKLVLPESHGKIYLQIIKWKLPWDSLSSKEQEKCRTKAELLNRMQNNSMRSTHAT